MKSNSRVLRGWRDFGVKATAIILTILLATQMVGTPAFATATMSNKQASEDIATTVDDTGVELSGTEATDTTVPDEAAGAANEPAPADSTQATEEPVAETAESATEPATETPAADPAANAVSGTEPEPAPAPAVEQDQLASIELNLADGASITLSKDGNKIDDDTNPVDVPANEELKFTAAAPEGMQISAVKTFINGVESDPIAADENGEYTIAAEDVADGLKVKVETKAVETVEETDEIEQSDAVDISQAADIIVSEAQSAAPTEIAPMAIQGGLGTSAEDPFLILPGETHKLTNSNTGGTWSIKKGSSTSGGGWKSPDRHDNSASVNGASVVDVTSGYDIGIAGADASATFSADRDAASDDMYIVRYEYETGFIRPQSHTVYYYFQIAESNRLEVTLESNSLEVGSTTMATASDNEGVVDNVTWTSGDEAIATVDANGQVTGVSEGNVRIIATDSEGRSAQANLTVTAQMARVEFIITDGNLPNATWQSNPSREYEVGEAIWGENQTFADRFGYPTREGYVFAGWDKSVSRIVTGDVAYTAKWLPKTQGKTPVYVYTQVTGGDTSGLILNKDGWYTIGVIFLDNDMLEDAEYVYDDVAGADCYSIPLDRQGVTQAIDAAMGSIVRYQDNQSINIEDLRYRILKTAGGASDYVTDGTTWHLDCTIDIKDLVNYTVKYVESGTDAEISDSVTSVASEGAVVTADQHMKSVKNYTYLQSEPRDGLTVTSDGDNILTLYYSRKNDHLTYYANNGTNDSFVAAGDAGEEISVTSETNAGFSWVGHKFLNWNTEADGSGKEYNAEDSYELDGDVEDVLYAQWQELEKGDSITVEVTMDGQQVNAEDYVTPSNMGNNTTDFAYTSENNVHTITFYYDKLNCADFYLDVFNIPTGYMVENVTSSEPGPTEDAELDIHEVTDDPSHPDRWHLDNVPGGSTVTVKLVKMAYTVTYEAEEGGMVASVDNPSNPAESINETVRYGENAKGAEAKADEGYYFVNWTDADDEEVSTDPTYKPENVTANATYTAHFAKKHAVTVTANSTKADYDGTEKSASGFQGETEQGVPVVANGITYYVTGLT
ncbi:MAG: Ig-like domain-containing protein, partial [Eggerthellaceae bacterium]